MIKYYDKAIVFQEVPDEISLAINITNCPHRCKNCHSPYLQDDCGTDLTFEELSKLINEQPHITCVLFMGGDSNHNDIVCYANFVHNVFGLKVAMYSGDDEVDYTLLNFLDYYKFGSYQEDKGGLDKPTTNQVMLSIEKGEIKDITKKFQKFY